MNRLAMVPLVATLSVAIAFNVVSVSVLRSLLERPFPYPALDRVVLVRDARPADGVHQGRAIATADFFDLRTSVPALTSLSAFRASPLIITHGGADPERIEAVAVTSNFFTTLEITPMVGTLWAADVDQAGRDRVVVLSRRLWHTRFGDDRGVIGRQVSLNGRDAVVLAILADDECYPPGVDAWVPLPITDAERSDRTTQRLNGIARIASSVSFEVARDQLNATARRLSALFPATNTTRGFDLLPLRREQYEFTMPLFGLVQAAGVLVLALALVNVTAVLVAKWLDRSHELMVRAMLGASGHDLAALVVRETSILTLTATFIGIAGAFPALDALRASLPAGIEKWVNGWMAMHVDPWAIGVGAAIGAGMTAVIGGAVTVSSRHRTLAPGVGVRVTKRRSVLQRGVVATQVGLAAALLLCAFVVVDGLSRQTHAFAALMPDRLLRFTVTTPAWRYADDVGVSAFHVRMIDGIQALPGIDSAGLIRNEPASNVPSPVLPFERRDARAPSAADRPRIDVQTISPSTFAVLRLPVTSGRAFVATDTADAARVAIVSQSAMRRYWPDRDPVGTLIDIDRDASSSRIVGVVGDFKLNWYDPEPRPTLYIPDAQAPARTTAVVVRTRLDPIAVAPHLRSAAARVDPLQPIDGLEPLAASIADSLSPVRVIERLLAIGAAIACLLAAIGVFGVLAQTVTQRLREFGVRFAIGATSRSIAMMVLRDACITGAVGLLIGVVSAAIIVHLAAAAVIGVGSVTARPVTVVIVCTFVLVLVAAATPAVRAARVDVSALLRT